MLPFCGFSCINEFLTEEIDKQCKTVFLVVVELELQETSLDDDSVYCLLCYKYSLK